MWLIRRLQYWKPRQELILTDLKPANYGFRNDGSAAIFDFNLEEAVSVSKDENTGKESPMLLDTEPLLTRSNKESLVMV